MSMSLLKGSALLLVTTSVDLTLRRLTLRKFSLLARPAKATSAMLECLATRCTGGREMSQKTIRNDPEFAHTLKRKAPLDSFNEDGITTPGEAANLLLRSTWILLLSTLAMLSRCSVYARRMSLRAASALRGFLEPRFFR